jgi:hypothetical protein
MRLRGTLGLALAIGLACAGTGAGALLVSCVDLFHSTADILTACELDATTPGCTADADIDAPVEAGPTDFCAWTPSDARDHARHACAWLGACETPLGRNAFGSCMFEALLAYDCAANPNHPARDKARALWDCLWRVNTCADVDQCVFPKGTQTCKPKMDASFVNFVQCSNVPGNGDVRVECSQAGSPTRGENCALWGQTCANTSGVEAICAGDPGGSMCASSMCSGGTLLHWCGDGGNVGIDCASNGGQACAQQGGGDAAPQLVCAPSGDGAACAVDASVTCSGGTAVSCPDGVVEQVNCASLLGGPPDASACASGPASPPFDWTSPCAVSPPSCTQDSCQGSVLTGCWRGGSFAVDCQAEGLHSCGVTTTDLGAVTHAACAHP